MSQTFLEVDPSEISIIENNIDANLQNFMRSLNTLKELMVRLDVAWDGSAGDQFGNRFRRDMVSCEKVLSVYKILNEKLKSAGTAYQKADTDVLELVKNMRKS